MPTFNQLEATVDSRPHRKKKTRVKQLQKCPQKRGICFKLFIMTPKKPNSAKRRVAKIKLSTKKFVFGYIPGEGNNLQKFSHVLIRGGLIRDLPGVHYTIIRGKLDLHSILYRRQGRSKYGTKLWWKPKKKERNAALLIYKKKIYEKILNRLQFKFYRRVRSRTNRASRSRVNFPNLFYLYFPTQIPGYRNPRPKKHRHRLKVVGGYQQQVGYIFFTMILAPYFRTLPRKIIEYGFAWCDEINYEWSDFPPFLPYWNKAPWYGYDKKKPIRKKLKQKIIRRYKRRLFVRRWVRSFRYLCNYVKRASNQWRWLRHHQHERKIKRALKKKKLNSKPTRWFLPRWNKKRRQGRPKVKKKKILFHHKVRFPRQKFYLQPFQPSKKSSVIILQSPTLVKKSNIRLLDHTKVKRRANVIFAALREIKWKSRSHLKFGLTTLFTSNKDIRGRTLSNLSSRQSKSRNVHSVVVPTRFQSFRSKFTQTKITLFKKPKISGNVFSHCQKLILKKKQLFEKQSRLYALARSIMQTSTLCYNKLHLLAKLHCKVAWRLFSGFGWEKKVLFFKSFGWFMSTFLNRLFWVKVQHQETGSKFFWFLTLREFWQKKRELKPLDPEVFSRRRLRQKFINKFRRNAGKKRSHKRFRKVNKYFNYQLRMNFFSNRRKYNILHKFDVLYHNTLYQKFLNSLFLHGHPSAVFKASLSFNSHLKAQTNLIIFHLFVSFLQDFRIPVELIPMKRAGRIVYIPTPISFLRQFRYTIKLLKKGISSRDELTFFDKFYAEMSDILLNQKGSFVQRMEKVYQLADSNQPNIHFRWKKPTP